MEYLYCALCGYLVGTINPSYIIGKLKGKDIRNEGSGNAGASNILILYGKILGVACALFDIVKAYLVIWGMQNLFPDFSNAFSVTATSCILGHIFPFYMKFQGGKGLACLGGMILCYDWKLFLIMLAVEIILAFSTDYICVVPITASIAFNIMYCVWSKNYIGTSILAVSAIIIFLKHIENMKRIIQGREIKMSFLWKPDDEINRVFRK